MMEEEIIPVESIFNQEEFALILAGKPVLRGSNVEAKEEKVLDILQ